MTDFQADADLDTNNSVSFDDGFIYAEPYDNDLGFQIKFDNNNEEE